MRIESLMLFLSVVEHGSISHAAKRCYISQQGASSIIKGLENDFGIILFERSNNALVLTEAGRRFAQEAERVVDSYHRLQTAAALGNGPAPANGPLRVVTTPFTIHALSPLFEAYREADKGRNPLIVTERSIFDIAERFPNLDPDVLYIVNVPAFMRGIVHRLGDAFEPLVVSELVIYCSKGSPLADKGSVDGDDLRGAQFACYNEDLVKRLVQHLIKKVDGAEIRVETTNIELIQQAVNEQHMIGVSDSLSVYLSGESDKGMCASLAHPIRFATGFLGDTGNEQAKHFAAFFLRYLSTVCAGYLKHYRVEDWAAEAFEGNWLEPTNSRTVAARADAEGRRPPKEAGPSAGRGAR